VSVGDAVAVGLDNAINNAVSSTLKALDSWLLLVRVDVKLDEQEQITAQNTATKQGSRLSPSTVPNVRQVPLASSEARIGAKVYCEKINDELGYLHRGQVLLPPDPLSTSGSVVVVIHKNVNCKVKGDDDPRDAGATVKLSIAQESGNSVVVHMQESKGFLLQDEENGVDELEVLEIVVDDVIEL